MKGLKFFILKKIATTLPVLFFVLFVVFTMSYLLPGNVALHLLGPTATIEDVQAMERQLGLDQPLHVQFGTYLNRLFHGDLGYSWSANRPVADEIAFRLPASMELATISLFLALAVAVPLGIASALKPNGVIDNLSRFVSSIGNAMPVFVVCLLVIYVFYFLLRWLPPPLGRLGGTMIAPPHITGMYILDSLLAGDIAGFKATLWYILAPAISLALGLLAPIVRMVRTFMSEVLNSDYINFARANGLSEKKLVLRYALKNILVPVLTVIALTLSYLLGATMITELLFGWPGVGKLALDAATINDSAVLLGVILVLATSYITMNTILDIVYMAIDPRIKI